MSRSRLLVPTLWLLAGCSPATNAEGAPLAAPERPEVVVHEIVAEVPEGGDLPDTVHLALADEEGVRPLEGAAWGGAAFQGGALVLRPDRTLEMVRPGAQGTLVDRDVVFAPVVSADGQHAAWAAARGEEQVLVVVDRDGGRADAAHGLASIGGVSFDDQGAATRRVAFVGAMNGGVAGVWVARVDGSVQRCITNCALRTGQPFDGHVPLPEDGARFEADALVFRASGREHRVALPEELR